MKRFLRFISFLFMSGAACAQSTLPACRGEFSSWSDCFGEYTSANGNKYVGEWKDGKANGQGTSYASNGSVIRQGIWIDGSFVSSSSVQQATAPNTELERFREEAEIIRNKPQSNLPPCPSWGFTKNFNCYTKMLRRLGTGEKYEGELREGKYHGQGTLIYANGDKYVGEFKDGQRNGQGTLFSQDGIVKKQGGWASNNLVFSALEQQAITIKNETERLRANAEESKKKQAELEEQLRIVQQQTTPEVIPSPPSITMANRRALVIGNDSYKSVAKLLNAREDARTMASNLTSVGYQVTLKLDLNEKEMKAAMRNFAVQVQGGDEVLFFFAGHGVQLGSTNYLLPTDIGGESEAQVRDESIQLQRILDDMSDRKAKLTLAVIDACRDNPFKSSGRAIGGRGLAPTTAATGQMVIFSAGTGQQALDKLNNADKNKNGLFTRVFVQEMQKPNQSIDRVVKNVRNQVAELAKSVGHEQVPAIYDQVLGDFYFKK